jgi:hypothetical protein
MTRQEAVQRARSCNHEALRFKKKGKPSVMRYFLRQRASWMHWARACRPVLGQCL